jgi:hypothetical protein
MNTPLAVTIGFAVAVLGTGAIMSGHSLTMPAFADESPAPAMAINPNQLVKIDGRSYQVSFDDTVDMVPTSQASVTKVGYGRSQQVKVVWSSTGVYSTDALASPNVLYPGVTVERAWAADTAQMAANMALASSFSFMVGPLEITRSGEPGYFMTREIPGGNGKAILSDTGNCIESDSFVSCF